MKVLMVSSEASPWAKTGGLADVVGALPSALERLGHEVVTVLPKYRGVAPPPGTTKRRHLRLGHVGHDAVLHESQLSAGHRLIMVDVAALFEREGIYGAGGVDYADNAERFGILSAAALEVALDEPPERPFDILHAHDWQAGLAPTLLHTMPDRYGRLAQMGLVFTIHNIAYQGLFARETVPALGLPWSAFHMDRGEFFGQFSLLKSGIAYSDFITTVSPTYARETLLPEFGFGLEGLLSLRPARYVGILNGIDTDVWNPQRDPYLPAHFDSDDLTGKAACKRALLERFHLAVGDDAVARPIVGMVSRLVEQKGLDIIREAASSLANLDASWVFVGMGDKTYEVFLREFAARFPSRIAVHVGFSEPLAHLVEAGADLFLMPSKFEPCGLNQMYSLRYGTVPVVTAVGGLEDTVRGYSGRSRRANGFKMRECSAEALIRTVRQATRVYRDRAAWRMLMQHGMAADHSWQTSAKEYVKVYRRAREAAVNRGGG
ncbi:MAG: glycogen synthase GlgA [Vicinamibacterales bacterium]